MSDALVFAWVAERVASRRQLDRTTLAQKLESTLDRVAERFADEWLLPPTLTSGLDEIRGVLVRPDAAFDAAAFFNQCLWPARFRVSVASGTVSVTENGADAPSVDLTSGSAFQRATDALVRMDKADLPFGVELADVPTETIGLIEAAGRLHAAVLADWTPSQARDTVLYRELKTQSQVARSLNITQQAISKSLLAAHAADLAAAETAVRAWLQEQRPVVQRATTLSWN